MRKTLFRGLCIGIALITAHALGCVTPDVPVEEDEDGALDPSLQTTGGAKSLADDSRPPENVPDAPQTISLEEEDPATVRSSIGLKCGLATAALVTACGATIATCIKSGGTDCPISGEACKEAAKAWRCACKHVCE